MDQTDIPGVSEDEDGYIKCDTIEALSVWAAFGGVDFGSWQSLDHFIKDSGCGAADELIGVWFTFVGGRLYLGDSYHVTQLSNVSNI